MKLIYVALIGVGNGFVGFVTGGGLGLWGGTIAGGFAGGAIGSATGACMTVDAATTLGILTPDRAEKIGVKLLLDNIVRSPTSLGVLPEQRTLLLILY